MAYETPLTIAEVMKDISANKYVLPSIQREYVWDTTQIETLFDSLMQDYPIGTLLFWEISKDKQGDYDFYEFLKNYHEKNSAHNKKADLKRRGWSNCGFGWTATPYIDLYRIKRDICL